MPEAGSTRALAGADGPAAAAATGRSYDFHGCQPSHRRRLTVSTGPPEPGGLVIGGTAGLYHRHLFGLQSDPLPRISATCGGRIACLARPGGVVFFRFCRRIGLRSRKPACCRRIDPPAPDTPPNLRLGYVWSAGSPPGRCGSTDPMAWRPASPGRGQPTLPHLPRPLGPASLTPPAAASHESIVD